VVKVALWGTLRQYADGLAEVEVEAATFKQLLDVLSARYPGLKPQIARGVSVAIDGRVYREAWFTPIKPGSQVVLMPYMVGG